MLWCVVSAQHPHIRNWNYTSPLIALTTCRIMAPQGTASSVFTEFESNGWPSVGLACLVGLNAPVAYLTGADSSAHLSEELKNAAWTLPRSMIFTAISNYITSFIIVGTFSFILARIIAKWWPSINLSHFNVLPGRYWFRLEIFHGSALYRGDSQRNGACDCYSYSRSVMFCQSRHDNFEAALVRSSGITFLPTRRASIYHRV